MGDWLILEHSPEPMSRSYHVLCRCKCGIEKLINFHSLLNKQSSSCQKCAKHEASHLTEWMKHNGGPNKKPKGVAAFNHLYNQYRSSAKSKRLVFSLTKDEFRKITQKKCHYCDSEPADVRNTKGLNGSYTHNGIDRKNNNIGYTLENSLPCCSFCNYLKKHHNYDVFVLHIHKISGNLKKMKRNHGNKELSQIQSVRRENEKLKRQISSLRKQIARLDLDRYDNIKELIESHYKEDRAEQGKEILESLKKSWSCRECDTGYMEIFVYNRGGETHYYRICSNAPACMNRTKSKLYSSQVKGIIRKDSEEQS